MRPPGLPYSVPELLKRLWGLMRVRDYSVVICVYTEDRWDQICAAVQSVRAQSLPCAEIIVVVDYNRALYERLTAAMPDVTVVENTDAKGLSGARNTGSALAKGEIIAFLDDDATAHPDWLKFIDDSYADPAITGVGGLTLPNWQTARPSWLPEEFYWVVGCNYLGMPPSGAPVRNLLGGNMSFRREVFDARRRLPVRHRAEREQAAAWLRGNRVLHPAQPALAGARCS